MNNKIAINKYLLTIESKKQRIQKEHRVTDNREGFQVCQMGGECLGTGEEMR